MAASSFHDPAVRRYLFEAATMVHGYFMAYC
jgi:hypothetical protein